MMSWGWGDCVGFWDRFDSGGLALDGVGVVLEVELLKLLVGRELFKIFVVGLFL